MLSPEQKEVLAKLYDAAGARVAAAFYRQSLAVERQKTRPDLQSALRVLPNDVLAVQGTPFAKEGGLERNAPAEILSACRRVADAGRSRDFSGVKAGWQVAQEALEKHGCHPLLLVEWAEKVSWLASTFPKEAKPEDQELMFRVLLTLPLVGLSPLRMENPETTWHYLCGYVALKGDEVDEYVCYSWASQVPDVVPSPPSWFGNVRELNHDAKRELERKLGLVAPP